MMDDAHKKKPTSKLMLLLYLIIGMVLLTLVLEMTGMADVAGTRETEEIIDRPH